MKIGITITEDGVTRYHRDLLKVDPETGDFEGFDNSDWELAAESLLSGLESRGVETERNFGLSGLNTESEPGNFEEMPDSDDDE